MLHYIMTLRCTCTNTSICEAVRRHFKDSVQEISNKETCQKCRYCLLFTEPHNQDNLPCNINMAKCYLKVKTGFNNVKASLSYLHGKSLRGSYTNVVRKLS